MTAHGELTAAGVTTRKAAALTGMARSTMDRRTAAKTRPTPETRPAITPANALSPDERKETVAVLNSDEFVDTAPAAIYATLLARGVNVV